MTERGLCVRQDIECHIIPCFRSHLETEATISTHVETFKRIGIGVFLLLVLRRILNREDLIFHSLDPW